MRRGEFREDLFHRLAGAVVRVPSLSERRSDIPELVSAFASEYGEPAAFAGDALDLLGASTFPGEVRGLRLFVQRTLALVDHRPITVSDLEPRETDPNMADTFYAALADAIIDRGGEVDQHLTRLRDAVYLAARKRAGGVRAGARLVKVKHSTYRARLQKAAERVRSRA